MAVVRLYDDQLLKLHGLMDTFVGIQMLYWLNNQSLTEEKPY